MHTFHMISVDSRTNYLKLANPKNNSKFSLKVQDGVFFASLLTYRYVVEVRRQASRSGGEKKVARKVEEHN